MEFTGKLLGYTPESALPWEHSARIRPWFQPWLQFLLSRVFFFLDDPQSLATLFRVFHALLGWGSTLLLVRASFHWFADRRLWNPIAWSSGLLWFVPFIHARPSAEALAGTLFLLGAVVQFVPFRSSRWAWVTGLLFGASFLAKYQSGLLIAGFCFALLAVGEGAFSIPRWRRTLAISTGILAMLALGILLDKQGYGHWQFTPWKYFYVNLIEGVSFRFSKQPWWFYFKDSALFIPPLSTILVLGFLEVTVTRIRHPLILSVIPYLLIHTAISNKELRFLFPFLPAVVPLLFHSRVIQTITLSANPWLRRVRLLLSLQNLALLIAIALIPASSSISFYEAIHRETEGAMAFYGVETTPYRLLDLEVHFYRRQGVPYLQMSNWQAIEDVLSSEKDGLLIFVRGLDLPPDASRLQSRCEPIYRLLPPWIYGFNFGNWVSRSRAWSLHRCQ